MRTITIVTETEPHPYKANRAPMDSDKQRCLDCDEPPQHPNHQMPEEAQAIERVQQEVEQTHDWAGDNPFWLMFHPTGENNRVGIDLDVPGWVEENMQYMRDASGTWYLMVKASASPLFTLLVEPGDQFYYAKRHVGVLGAQTAETVCYGIGKKKADGTPVNLWLLPDGTVCGGDDVDALARRML